MGVYYCIGCDTLKDDDYDPCGDSGMCYMHEEIIERYTIKYNPKPIPSRQDDWDWVHKDYDGPEDGRCGTAGSYEGCLIQILELDNEY